MNNQSEKRVDREISATTRWAILIILTIVTQSAGILWFFAGLNAQTMQTAELAQSNAESIRNLEKGAAVILTREQLDDILGSRDIRLDNIEKTLTRIESKL